MTLKKALWRFNNLNRSMQEKLLDTLLICSESLSRSTKRYIGGKSGIVVQDAVRSVMDEDLLEGRTLPLSLAPKFRLEKGKSGGYELRIVGDSPIILSISEDIERLGLRYSGPKWPLSALRIPEEKDLLAAEKVGFNFGESRKTATDLFRLNKAGVFTDTQGCSLSFEYKDGLGSVPGFNVDHVLSCAYEKLFKLQTDRPLSPKKSKGK